MKRLIFALAFLGLSSIAFAQAPVVNPPVTSVTFVISGGVSPVTAVLPVTSMTSVACPSGSGSVQNPSAFVYQVNATDTTCWKYQDPGTGPLLSLPVGGTTYTATLAYTNANGNGPVSNVSNSFSRPGVLPSTAPVGLSVR